MQHGPEHQNGGEKLPSGRTVTGKTSSGVARRLFWFRLAALLGIPLLLLLSAEGLLRVAGFGYSPRFFIRDRIREREVWTDNQQFARRFFPPELVRYPRPFTMPAAKAAGTLRVFVLGESAAMGDPDARFGLSRMLQVLLRERFPMRRIEVINAAMVAINSHAILPIARDCAKHEGDLWVIYMGNNEVIGPFGSASVFGEAAPPLPIIRAGLCAKETKVGQLMDAALDAALPGNSRLPDWGGMQMMSDVKVGAQSAGTLRVLRHFERNLAEILETGSRARVPILLCTVAVNLKDCAPFASVHRTDLTGAELADWEAAYRDGVELRAKGKLPEAQAAFDRAYKLDPEHAELSFLMAQCRLQTGRAAEAAVLFAKARDLDALQFRADSRINGIVRRVANQFADRGVHLLDAEASFAKESPQSIPGSEWFYEHVHLTPEGNYLLARGVAEEALVALKTSADGEWTSREECLSLVGFREWNRFEAYQTIESLIQNPPFTRQINHEEQKHQIQEQLSRLRTTDKPAQVKREERRLAELVAKAPEDPDLRWNYAVVLEAVGDDMKAEQQWRALLELHPHAALPAINLARLVERLGRADEASTLYERGLELQPRYFPARYALGLLYLRAGNSEAAIKHLRHAVRQKPGDVDCRLHLAEALAKQGRATLAEEQYREVLHLDPSNAQAQHGLRSVGR